MSHAKMKPAEAKQYSAQVTSENVNNKYDLAVIIGRFEPLHVGHSVLLNQAFAVANHVLVLVGSPNVPRTIKNPFTYDERKQMILDSVSQDLRTRIGVLDLPDNLYSDDEWVRYVQEKIENCAQLRAGATNWSDKRVGSEVCIVGNKKDDSSYYLDKFPQYAYINVDEVKLGLDATTIRNLIYEAPDKIHLIQSLVPKNVYDFLTSFVNTDEYKRLVREHEMIKKYKESWANSPHPPFFVTVDAVVKKNGHILLVRRKDAPGEGLLALPGGFVNPKERLKDAAIRELNEETCIDLPPGLLANSVVDHRVFDHPGRSLRGRTITHAFLFDLDKADSKPGLPKVKGADDAESADWFMIDQAIKLASETYEDHNAIWRSMLGV